MTFSFDPRSHELHEDPFPTYRRLRDEFPLYHNETGGFWALSRFEDVRAAVHDPATFSSARGITLTETAFRNALPTMITMDPPRHDELRTLVKRSFTPRRIEGLTSRVRAVARELLDGFSERGHCDLVAEFAGPLPTIVIAELLGVPGEDRDMFRRCSDAVVRGDSEDPALRAAAADAGAELAAYFAEVIAERRRSPGDDLVTELVRTQVDDRSLSDEELLGFCFLLLAAGNETTMNLIGNAAVLLARHPDQRAMLADDPALLGSAVEEFLRFESPVQALVRTVTRTVELHGGRVPEGAKVVLVLGAASRDDREFDDPDRFDILRGSERHLAFGLGPHYCLGAALARMEAKVAFEELLARIPAYHLATDHLERVHSGIVRGLERIPLEFEPTPVPAPS